MANIIDFLITIGMIALGVYLGAVLNDSIVGMDTPHTLLLISQVCIIVLLPILVQSPFWAKSTTLGKSMMFIKVVNSKKEDLDYFQMMTREFLLKVLSCYFVFLPMLIGRPGVHEAATDSMVIIKPYRGQENAQSPTFMKMEKEARQSTSEKEGKVDANHSRVKRG